MMKPTLPGLSVTCSGAIASTERQRRLVDADIVDAVDHQRGDAVAGCQPFGGEGGAPAGALRRRPAASSSRPSGPPRGRSCDRRRRRASSRRGRERGRRGSAIRRSGSAATGDGDEAGATMSIGLSEAGRRIYTPSPPAAPYPLRRAPGPSRSRPVNVDDTLTQSSCIVAANSASRGRGFPWPDRQNRSSVALRVALAGVGLIAGLAAIALRLSRRRRGSLTPETAIELAAAARPPRSA